MTKYTPTGWFCAIFLLCLLAGCAHNFERGTEAIEDGDAQRAESIAGEELEDDPNSPWGNLLMAEALVAQDNHRDARPYARRADASGAFPVRAPRLLGDMYTALGRPVDAAKSYARAREQEADSVDDEQFIATLENAIPFAEARTEHGDLWQLSQWLVDVDPTHPLADPSEIAVRRRAQAVELRRQGNYFDAAELLEQALDDDPAYLRGEALDLGEIYARMDMPEEAQRAWTIYLDGDVDQQEMIQRHRDVATMAARHNQHEVAAQTLETLPPRIDDRYERAEIMLDLARHQLRAEQGSQARQTIYDYVELLTEGEPEGQTNYIPYQNAIELALELNQTRLAINLLERAVNEARPSRVLTRQLADMYARRAQLTRVEEVLDLFISRHHDSMDATLFAGQWAFDRNNYDLARRYFEAATELENTPPDAWYSLAQSFAGLEEYDAMSRAIHAYVDARNDRDDALLRAGNLLLAHRLYEESERFYQRLQQRRPADRQVAMQRAELYGQWSRPAEAASVWDDWLAARDHQTTDIAWVARMALRAGDLGRASNYYIQAAEAGEIDAWLDAADIFLRQDRTSAMSRALASYLDEHPDRAAALEQAATRYRRAGMDARHIDTLVELADMRPRSWQVHERLATILLDQGRSTEAFDHLRRFVERADDPVEALDQISSPIASRHPPSWLLDFYRIWEDDDTVGPAIHRLLGDAYYSLSVASATSESTADYARRQAREHYLDYLEATEGESKDWRRLAIQWRQNEMWRPAALAFERHAEGRRDSRFFSLAYAETLLRLGERQRAEEVLQGYFHSEQRTPAAANRIASILRDFRLYDQVEQYAGHLFLAGDDSSISEGFHLLAEIYEEREDYEQLQELSTDYMNRATNKTRARRAVIQVLSSAGQWELAARQLREFEITTISQFAVDIGRHHYRSGHHDQAFAAFEEAADVAHRPERTWAEVAEFLAHRGDHERTQMAYDRAVRANPDELTSRTARGVYRIQIGDIDAALEDYEFSRQSATDFRPSQRMRYFQAFSDIGDFPRAQQVFSDLRDDGLTPPGEMQKTVGTRQLRSGNAQQIDAAIDPIRAGTWGIHDTLRAFEEAGHHHVTLRLIEEEFEEGDPSMAAALLLNRSPAVSRFVDWDQQRVWLRSVVDPLARNDTRLLGAVGDHRARAGELEDAQIYLQAAVDHGDHNYRPQLAHTLLLSGERQAAIEAFATYFTDYDASPESLETILLRFELVGDDEGARQLLERLIDEPSLIDFVLPYRVQYQLEHHGDPDRAIEEVVALLRALENLPTTAFREGVSARATAGISRDDVIGSALIGSLETVAALGYVDAVIDVLDDSLPGVAAHEIDGLRFKMALASDDLETANNIADEILAAADGARELEQARLSTARRFIAFGAHDQAHRFVDDALDEQSDYRDHHPFRLRIALLVLDDIADLSPVIDEYLERVPNRHHARTTLIDELQRLGRDEEALRLASEGAAIRPTTDALRRALVAGIDAGDHEAVQTYTTQLFATADEPIDEVRQALSGRLRGLEPDLALPVVEAIRDVRPHDLSWTIAQARLLFSDGQLEKARALVGEALETRAHNRDAVTEVVELMAEESLDAELVHLIAPTIPDEALWPHLIILFAEANFALRRQEQATEWLERLDASTDDAWRWRIELGERLVRRKQFDALRPTLQELYDADLAGPYVEYLRGLQQLAAGEPNDGLAAIRSANTDGVGRFRTHYNGIQAALQSGHTDTALAMMEELSRIPMRDDEVASLPLQTLLSAAMNQPQGPATIRTFLEGQRPRLIDGYGATWTQFAGQLARAFEMTDDPEGAYGFYRDRIWQSLLLRDEQALPIYLNNLAYTYSTTDRHLDRGMDKVLRAIVLRQERSASFLDTLGWLQYRQGNYQRAEAEIRRALRTYERGPSGLHELYKHLEQILEFRGDFQGAAWLEANRNRLPPEGFGW